jgi:hypothetical protein
MKKARWYLPREPFSEKKKVSGFAVAYWPSGRLKTPDSMR